MFSIIYLPSWLSWDLVFIFLWLTKSILCPLHFISKHSLTSLALLENRNCNLETPKLPVARRLFHILLFVLNSSTTWMPIVGLDCQSLPCGVFCAYLVGYFVGIGCSTYHPGNDSPLWNLIIITIINIIIVIIITTIITIIIIIIIIIITFITITTIINFFNVHNQNMQIMCIVKNSHLQQAC